MVYGPVEGLLPLADWLLNWSAFFTLVAEFGLDPRVVVRSVTEEGGVNPFSETVLICRDVH